MHDLAEIHAKRERERGGGREKKREGGREGERAPSDKS